MPSPVDLIELPFLREALIEVVLLALAGGMVGAGSCSAGWPSSPTRLGRRRFPGLVTADATGISASLLALAVALGYAGGVGGVRRAGRESEAATALLLVAALGLGVILASDVFESGASVDRLLFGTLLGLDGSDLVLSAACALVALAATLTLGRAWTAIGFDPESAPALGPAGRARRPRAARAGGARCRGRDPRRGSAARGCRVRAARRRGSPGRAQRAGADGWAVALALVEASVGLYLAYWLDAPPGPPIAVLGATVYGVLAIAARLTAAGRRW